MSTIEQYEDAVKAGLLTYKDIVKALCASNPEIAKKLFEDVSKPSDDPKVMRKKFRAEQVEKFGTDKDSINDAMKSYDDARKPQAPKAKRAPPPPRQGPLTDEEKAYRAAKREFLDTKREELGGDDAVISVMKTELKKAAKAYDKEHKKPKAKATEPVTEPANEQTEPVTKPKSTKPKSTKPTKPNSTKLTTPNSNEDDFL